MTKYNHSLPPWNDRLQRLCFARGVVKADGMHDILRHRRGCWPEVVESVLASVEGFESAVVGDSGLSRQMRDVCELIEGLEIPRESVRLGASELVRGLLWYAVDDLQRAHAVFQEESGFLGSYCHGMMHRREGDFWNANYWFRAAGRPPVGMFEADFRPEQLTTACERAGRVVREGEVLQALAEEAARMFDYIFQRAA